MILSGAAMTDKKVDIIKRFAIPVYDDTGELV